MATGDKTIIASKDYADEKVLAPLVVGSSWDGDDYDDSAYWVPDNANSSAKVYPDGSVVGVTDNGNYTRWANGNLEVNGSVVINAVQNSTSSATPLYPILFTSVAKIDKPYTATAGPNNYDCSALYSGINDVAIYIYSAVATSDRAVIYSASGRWK